MISFYTYLHCRPDGSPFYVGKGCDSTHKRSHVFTRRNQHHKSVVAKYGRENIGVYIFPCESEEQAFKDEIQQIAQLRQEGYELCNYTDGGEGSSGYVPSEETRRKLSVSIRKGQSAPGVREKMSACHLGKKLSTEHRAKIAAANIGKKRGKTSPEVCNKISVALKGRKKGPMSAARKAVLSEKNVGKTLSTETRCKISEAIKTHWIGRRAK